MSRYYGNIDGVRAGRLTGYILDLQFLGLPVALDISVDGAEPVRIEPSIRRSVRQQDAAIDMTVDAGFEFDLSDHLARSSRDLNVRVVTADGAYELTGSPVRIGISPEAFVDPTRGGVVVGWAHEAWFAKCQVELWSDDEFLLSWPADQPRDDLRDAGLGDGECAFHIPIRLIYGDHPPSKLHIKMPGRPIALPVPPDITTLDPPGRSLAEARANAFGDLDELYRELERETLAIAADSTSEEKVEISFATLQALLDRLEMLSNERETLRLGAQIELTNAAGNGGQPHGLAPTFSAIETDIATRQAQGTDRREIIATEYVPRMLADEVFRSAFLDEIERIEDRDMLGDIAAAFHGADLMGLSRRVLQRSLAVSPVAAPAIVNRMRNLQAWEDLSTGFGDAEMLHPENIVPRQGGHRDTGRTLYCIWRSLPHESAGYDTRSHYLMRGFTQVGEDVIACTRPGFPWDGQAVRQCASFEVLDGINYVRLGSSGMRNSQLPLDRYLRAHANRIAHLALAAGVDMIHSATNWLVGLPALMAARRLGLPFVYEIRGLMEITRCANSPHYAQTDHFNVFRTMEAKVASSADLVFAITKGVRQEMAARGCDTSRFEIAPNGVDCQRFRPLRRDSKLAYRMGVGAETVFGFIGSFLRYEGVEELCAAAAVLKARNRRFRMLLVGDGPHAQAIRDAVAAHGVGDVVTLTGRVPFGQVPQYYSLIDVAVYPRQGIEVTEIVSPLKPFEAMAMGKPVIASDVAALAEIVTPGETGWLFRKNDIGSLVEALEAAIADPLAVERMGALARTFVTEHHDWPILAARMAEGWRDVRQKAGQRPPGELFA